MKLVIDINEKYIKELDKIRFLIGGKEDRILQVAIMKAIKNGTPLPKNHGRLIDADAFIAMLKDTTERQRYKELLIDDCLTVDDVINAIIESLQNEGIAEGDTPTIIKAENNYKNID